MSTGMTGKTITLNIGGVDIECVVDEKFGSNIGIDQETLVRHKAEQWHDLNLRTINEKLKKKRYKLFFASCGTQTSKQKNNSTQGLKMRRRGKTTFVVQYNPRTGVTTWGVSEYSRFHQWSALDNPWWWD